MYILVSIDAKKWSRTTIGIGIYYFCIINWGVGELHSRGDGILGHPMYPPQENLRAAKGLKQITPHPLPENFHAHEEAPPSRKTVVLIDNQALTPPKVLE